MFLFLFVVLTSITVIYVALLELEDRANRRYVSKNPHMFSKMDLERYNL